MKGTKGQLGIKTKKSEGEMKKLRQMIRTGGISMRCTVGAMYDYRKRSDRERRMKVKRGGFGIFFFKL